MATPVSAQQIRYRCAEPDRARAADAFAAWGWTGWTWGILSWFLVLYLAYPVLWTLFHGKLPPVTPAVGIQMAVYFVFTLIAVPAFALYASWVFFVVLRVTNDRITVGRWFGLRRRVYRASEISEWTLVDRRVRSVADVRQASRLRIDFLDGSWVGMPRWSWNFQKLEAWLAQRAGWGAAVGTAPPRAPTSTYHFMVRDVGMMLVAPTVWALCWMIGARYLAGVLSGKVPPPTDVGGVAILALVLVPVIAGPLCVHVLAATVRVDAPRIQVNRWFGLVRRTYHEDDIKFWRLSVDANHPPGWDRSLLLWFADGARVSVMSAAINFRTLREYLRDRASSREQVGRGRRTDESRKKATA
jgi:hypothetical protein